MKMKNAINSKLKKSKIPFFSGSQKWQVLVRVFLVLFAFKSLKVIITGSFRFDIFLSGTLAAKIILCIDSLVLLAVVRRDCGTKSLATKNSFVVSTSPLCISRRLFSSFATNVKLFDLFRIVSARFFFLKIFCGLADRFVIWTAILSKLLKNVDVILTVSLDWIKTS